MKYFELTILESQYLERELSKEESTELKNTYVYRQNLYLESLRKENCVVYNYSYTTLRLPDKAKQGGFKIQRAKQVGKKTCCQCIFRRRRS